MVQQRGGQGGFKVAVMEAMWFGPPVFLHLGPEAKVISWSDDH